MCNIHCEMYGQKQSNSSSYVVSFCPLQPHQNSYEGCAPAGPLQVSLSQEKTHKNFANCNNPWAHTFMVLSVFPICIWEQCHLAMIDCLSAAMLLQVFPGLALFQYTPVATSSAITSYIQLSPSTVPEVLLSLFWCSACTLLGVRIANSLNFQRRPTNFVSG